MALFNITIEKVIIKCDEKDDKTSELEKQMDEWLKIMKAKVSKLKTISEQVQ
jgi:hypothetical protein